MCVDDFLLIALTSTDYLIYLFCRAPQLCVNTHADDCNPDNRIQGHLSKENQQSLKYITESPLATAEGKPAIHAFDVGNRVMIGDIVVVYDDVVSSYITSFQHTSSCIYILSYKHGTECEVYVQSDHSQSRLPS